MHLHARLRGVACASQRPHKGREPWFCPASLAVIQGRLAGSAQTAHAAEQVPTADASTSSFIQNLPKQQMRCQTIAIAIAIANGNGRDMGRSMNLHSTLANVIP